MSNDVVSSVNEKESSSFFFEQNDRIPVQYITEDFLRRYTKNQDLSAVHHLCLTSNVISPYKLTLLENLEGLRYLTVLNVSGNAIERLEGLRSLTRLKCLNLNDNRICRLDGLETLKNLQRLYLNHNRIQDFPSWFQNRLISLKSLQLGHNNIDNLHILTKLRRLSNLTELVIMGNPASDPSSQHLVSICPSPLRSPTEQHEEVFNQCCRSFIIFHLRSLTLLDTQIVTLEERKEADSWFEQSEISRINNQLETREAEVADLSDCLARLSIEAEGRSARTECLARQKAAQDAKLEEMRRELAAKDELLRAKSDELLRACLKHYEIEQELAFYKIDKKFSDALGKPPDIKAGLNENNASTSGSIDPQTLARTNGLSCESPYLGKCRYFRVSGAPPNHYNPVPSRSEANCLPRVEENEMDGYVEPWRVKSGELATNSHSYLTQSSTYQGNTLSNGKMDDAELESNPDTSDEFSEHSGRQKSEEDLEEQIQQGQEKEEEEIRFTSTPLKMTRTASASKGKTTSFAVTMPFFRTSPEPSELTEDSSWYRGNNRDSPSSLNNQKSTTRSTVRIQCDSGIDAGNNCSNDVQESSLDDGRIESLLNSPQMDRNSSQHRESTPQTSTSHSLPRTSFSPCQTESPDGEIAHRQWQKRAKQRLAKSPHQSIESVNARSSVYENDLKVMKKELVRLQAAVIGLSTERIHSILEKSTTRSTVRIQCDSGIDAGNNCSNDVQESSLDDGRIESLLNSPQMDRNSSQHRESTPQTSTSHSLPRTSFSPCQTESPDGEIAHRQWQKRAKQRLAKSPHQSIESVNARSSVYENDLKVMKKELVRLQAAVIGLSTERIHSILETGSDGPGRQKNPDDIEFASSCSESPNPDTNKNGGNRSQRTNPVKCQTNKPSSSRRQKSNNLACSWNAGDQTEDSVVSEFDQVCRPGKKVGANRLISCLRGATSAIDIRRSSNRVSTKCLKNRGKSMENLPDNTPLDVQLLYKLQDELYDLHDRLQFAENANASRLEEAIEHIGVLENELKRSRRFRGSSGEKLWQNQLSEGLEEMRKCRDSILELQQKLARGSTGVPHDIHGSTTDINEMKNTLNAQERELSKLTRVVNRLTQNSHVIDNSTAEVTEVARMVSSDKLLCNVAEHHNLEDYLQHIQSVADDLRQQLQDKRAKLKELKTSSVELQSLLKEREAELARVTNELLASKEELLLANQKVKSIISERSLQNGQLEAQRSEVQRLESKITELTNHLGALRAEVSAMERQKERRTEELEELSRKVNDKRALADKRPSHAFTGFTTEVSFGGDGNPRSDSINSMSPQYDTEHHKLSEARNRMESLSREIGVRTAEIELLRSKKAQEVRLAETQLENIHRELQIKIDELSTAKEELNSVRQERDRLNSEINSTRSSLHLTTDGIPTISRDISDLTQQLNNLRSDVNQHKDEIAKLEAKRKARKEEVSQLEKSLVDVKEELTLTQTRRQNAETQLALARQKGEILKGQLEVFEASVEVKQKLISDLCSSSESRISAMEKEISRLVNSTQKIASEKATAKNELTKLQDQVQARKNELEDLELKISSARPRLKNSNSNPKLAKASDKLRAMNEKIASQKAEFERLSREVSERQAQFEKLKNLSADSDETTYRVEELENLLRIRDRKIETLTENNTKLMEDHSQIVSDLTSTRSQLEASQRACRKLKRRTAKELADLERVAEEQCSRASAFSEELALLRRNYAYLQARIAANEEISDRERKLQEALFAIKTEIASSNPSSNGINAALRRFSEIESLVRKSIHSPLNTIGHNPLKSFSSVPQLSIPHCGSMESVREDQQIPSPNPPIASTKNLQTQSSSGIGSSITPHSSSDDRLMFLQEQTRRQLFNAQENLDMHQLRNQFEPAATNVTDMCP
nr:centrosomal protein 1 [Hymenolepis microstoma]